MIRVSGARGDATTLYGAKISMSACELGFCDGFRRFVGIR
jgi:hypothetical protein